MKLHGLGLFVKDMPKMIRFYRDGYAEAKFDFVKKYTNQAKRYGIWININSRQARRNFYGRENTTANCSL